jgi:hypothetical protein
MSQVKQKGLQKGSPRAKKPEPLKNLEEAAKTFRERGASYGPSYIQYGEVMDVLFPDGVELKTKDDFNRMGLLNMVVSKLIRYSNQWKEPHKDSIHDLGVYAFMLEAVDDSIRH